MVVVVGLGWHQKPKKPHGLGHCGYLWPKYQAKYSSNALRFMPLKSLFPQG
jgi:hypothetical protein